MLVSVDPKQELLLLDWDGRCCETCSDMDKFCNKYDFLCVLSYPSEDSSRTCPYVCNQPGDLTGRPAEPVPLLNVTRFALDVLYNKPTVCTPFALHCPQSSRIHNPLIR